MPVVAKIVGVGLGLQDFDDFRMVRHPGNIRMQVDITEPPGKAELLFRRDLLVAKKDHAMIQQRLVNGGECRVVVKVAGQINPVQFRTKRPRDRPYIDRRRHRFSP